MEKTKSVQSLKRQLTAAIAMVLVAAIALISATYAWFVANNTVDATVSSITAQSNAAFLTINNENSNITETTTQVNLNSSPLALYPCRPDETNKGENANAWTATQKPTELKWQTAYAAKSSEAAALNNKYYDLTNADNSIGATGYVSTSSVYVSSSQGSFTNLKVDSMTVTGENLTDKTGTKIVNAVGALVSCGDNWELWEYDTDNSKWTQTCKSTDSLSGKTNNDNTKFGTAETNNQSVEVKITLFYDGDYNTITTNNLNDGSLGQAKVKLDFSATPVQQSVDGNYEQTGSTRPSMEQNTTG